MKLTRVIEANFLFPTISNRESEICKNWLQETKTIFGTVRSSFDTNRMGFRILSPGGIPLSRFSDMNCFPMAQHRSEYNSCRTP